MYDPAMTGEPRPYHHGHLREALLEAAERTLEPSPTRNDDVSTIA